LLPERSIQNQTQQVLDAIERLSRSRLHIVFGSGYTSADVRAYALQVQATEGFKPALILVDYVQLLRDEEGDGRIRERNVSAAAHGLKGISGELGLPVLALVQLNRNRATRVDKRPQLADLRESGDLENTADSVLGLYREEIDHPDSNDRGLAELSVLKKRQLGEEVGTIRRIVWVGESYMDYTFGSRRGGGVDVSPADSPTDRTQPPSEHDRCARPCGEAPCMGAAKPLL